MQNRTIAFRPVETHKFDHHGVGYDVKTNKISFSEEAKIALQILIDQIQSNFPNHIEQITEEVANSVIDAMVVAGKREKTTKKFLERVAVLLRKKKNEEVKVDKKVDKQIQKYTNPPFTHITIEYQEGDKKIILNDAPIIVRPHEKIGEILKSLQQRLNFSKILGELPEKSS